MPGSPLDDPKNTLNLVFFMGNYIYTVYIYISLVGGIPTPLKNDGLRQLG